MSATIIPFPQRKRDPVEYSHEMNALIRETAIRLRDRTDYLVEHPNDSLEDYSRVVDARLDAWRRSLEARGL